MKRIGLTGAAAAAVCMSLAGSAYAVQNQAIDVKEGYPYYYTGYYQYGSSPYVAVPNWRLASSGYSYVFSPYYYGYSASGFYGTPRLRRPWSLGYMSDGHYGAYYY